MRGVRHGLMILALMLGIAPTVALASSCLPLVAPEVAAVLVEGDSTEVEAAIRALDEAAANADPIRAAPWRAAQASMLLDLERVDEAVPLLRQAIDAWRSSDAIESELCAHKLLVYGFWIHMRNEEALAEALAAEARAETAGLDDALPWLRQIRVALLVRMNQRLAEAVALMQGLPQPENPLERIQWHDSRGHMFDRLGRHDLATNEFERVIELASSIKRPSMSATGRLHLALQLASLDHGDLPKRESRIVELLQQVHEDPNARAATRAIALREHAVYLPPEQREPLLQQCIETASEAGDNRRRAVCLADLAEIIVARDPLRAIQRIEQALQAAGDDSRALWQLQHQRLTVIWHTMASDEAFDASLDALEGERLLREAQLDGPERALIIDGLMGDYRRVVRYSYERVGASSRSPATQAADTLAARAFTLMEANRALVLRERQQQQADGSEAESATTDPISELTVEAVQAKLAPDEAMLSFLTLLPGEDHSEPGWMHVITAQRHWLHRVPSDKQLRSAAELLHGLTDWRDPMARRLLGRLGSELLNPPLEALPDRIRRLVIIHDTGVDQVPLEALPLADGRALGTAYELNLVPAAAVWLRARSLRGEAGGGLVLADPRLPEAGLEALDSALDAPLPALPGTRLEAQFFAKRAGFSRIQMLSGENATEHRIKRPPATSTRLIHFGTHALINPDQPQHSAVLLAAGDGEDGLLQAAEIETLDMTGTVAVLAACASATGQWLDTEGVLGLARAFMIAGAPAVIATRWPVGDHAAAAYFTRMYRHLGRGATLDQAMRRARADLAEAGFPPRAWSAYVLIGDGAGKPLARKSPWPGILLIALAIGLIAAAVNRARAARQA